jgi:hypothetical protein
MAVAQSGVTAVVGGDVVVRRRGRSKSPNFTYNGLVSVIRLELDVGDVGVRQRLERQWVAVFRLRRALQGDAAAWCRAYRAAHRERAADPKAVRERLGLSRKSMEAAAKRHVEASGWMRDHLTKAVGLQVTDEVWETIDRYLFTDSSGRRHGAPRVGSWWDFTRIPGRARSHTKSTPSWETWRLVGTLAGHLNTYRHPGLPASVNSASEAAAAPAGTSILAEPTRLPSPRKPSPGSWWNQTGPLAVVFTGLPAGDLVMPVRLPQGAGQWAHLSHFLADPAVWHKIDLVRVRDRKAPGGWRYYAHLLTHQTGYQSPGTRARRAAIPTDRRAGVDANVSNLAIAYVPRRSSRPAVGSPDPLRHRPAADRSAGSQTGPGSPASAGALPAQHQPRPIRAVATAAETSTTSRHGRVAGHPGQQPGWPPRGPCRWGAAARLPPRHTLRRLSAYTHRSHR